MILDTIIKWIIPIIGAGILSTFTYIVKSNKTMRNSMVLILRSQIVGKCETYLEKGFLPDYARSCLEDLFEQYTSLGGNHGVNKLVDQCFELAPMKKKER